jgi:hypothetical protein
MGTIIDRLNLIKEYKSSIKDAINGKGSYVEDDFSTYAQAISDIPSSETPTYTWDDFTPQIFAAVGPDGNSVLKLYFDSFSFFAEDLSNMNSTIYVEGVSSYVGSERRALAGPLLSIKYNELIPDGTYSWDILANTITKVNPNFTDALEMNPDEYSYPVYFNKWSSQTPLTKIYSVGSGVVDTVVELRYPIPRLFETVPAPEEVTFITYGLSGPQLVSPISVSNEEGHIRFVFSGILTNGYYSTQMTRYSFYEIDSPLEVGSSSLTFNASFQATVKNIINREINVPIDTSVELVCTKSVDVDSSSIVLTRVFDNQTISTSNVWGEENTEVVISPVALLQPRTAYKLTCNLISSLLDESLEVTYIFTTANELFESL